ncbi:MAG: substrate-binding domain-containing protein [Planctomycetota bacterium]
MMNRTGLCMRSNFVMFVTIPLAGIACRSEEAPNARPRGITRIAVVGMGRDHPTWPVLQAVAKQVEGNSGRLEIRIEAPPTVSPMEQKKLLEGLIGQVDVICIEPSEQLLLAPTIDGIARGGIPVVTFGRDTAGTVRSVYCGPLESDIGEAAAEACGLLPKVRSTSVLLLHGGDDHAELSERHRGMRLKMIKSNGMTLLREVACGENRLSALEVVKAETRKYPRSAGWVMLDDWPYRAIGAKDRLVPEGYGVILCSNDPVYLTQVEDGRITALVSYDYRKAVQEALFASLRLLDGRGSAFSALVVVEPEIITRTNVGHWRERWRAWQTGELPPTTSRANAP